MVSMKNNSNKTPKTLKYKRHDIRRIPPKFKMHLCLRTTRCHKTFSAAGHIHLTYWTDMQSKSV